MLDVRKIKKGFICGAFDLLHAGHIHFIKYSKMNCDILVVAIQVDPSIERPEKNKPVESLVERIMKLKAIKYVDEIVVYEKEAEIELLIETLGINVRFLGSDYIEQNKPITSKDLVPIQYIHSLPIHSSNIRERIK